MLGLAIRAFQMSIPRTLSSAAWSLRDVTSRGFTLEQLYSTASYKSKDLQKVSLSQNNLAGVDFSGQNLRLASFTGSDLTSANLAGANLQAGFWGATLLNANFAEATIAPASLPWTTAKGFSKEQLYSTASYKARDLHHIGLQGNDLTEWDFANQDFPGPLSKSPT